MDGWAAGLIMAFSMVLDHCLADLRDFMVPSSLWQMTVGKKKDQPSGDDLGGKGGGSCLPPVSLNSMAHPSFRKCLTLWPVLDSLAQAADVNRRTFEGVWSELGGPPAGDDNRGSLPRTHNVFVRPVGVTEKAQALTSEH